MGGHAKKATKKFEKNRLKDTIGRRKEFAKIKQRHQVKDKKKARRAKENGAALDEEGDAKAEGSKEQEKPALQDMTMDEFFQGGLDILEPKKKKKKGKRVAESKEPHVGTSKASKRKRADDDEDDDEGEQENIDDAQESDSEGEHGETSLHKGDLDALAEKDPDFYKYLKENDAELLDFEEEDLEALDFSESEEEPTPKRQKKSSPAVGTSKSKNDSSEVTLSFVKKWKAAMETQHSLRATREVVLAFRAAAHANAEDDSSQSYKYTIPTPEAYHELLLTALTSVPKVLAHHLPPAATKGNKAPQVPTGSKKFRTLSPLLKSHTQSLIALLSGLSDDSTINLTLSSTLPLLPYLLSFKKLLKSLTKSILAIWSAPATSASNASSEKARLTAFLLLRTLAMYSDPSLLTALLKSTYQSLITAARTTNPTTLPTLNLLKNSASTLWPLDPNIGYTTAFTSIRQLAILLRAALTQPSKDSHAKVYNWQFIHSLDFWSRVLSAACSTSTNPTLKKPSDSPFHPLIYPLVQISLGALNLLPTPTYFPLHFHIVRLLLRISRQTTTYIPLFPPLLYILRSPTCTANPKASTLRPLDFRAIVRAPSAYLKTRAYQNGVGEQLVELMGEFFGVWAKNIAFPELCIPPVAMLKRWLKVVSSSGGGVDAKKSGAAGTTTTTTGKGKGGKKDARGNRNQRFNAQVALLVQKLNANASYVEERRRKVKFAPSDREEVDRFLSELEWEDLPLGAYLAARRVEREEKERVVDEARREEKEDREGAKGLKGEREEEEDDVEMEDGSENENEEDEVEDGEGGEEEDEEDEE